jgi:hypothetical protein
MTVDDIVKVTQYLTRAGDVKAYAQVRNRFLGAARPASMLLVVPQLVWPSLLVEVEVVAAKARSKAESRSDKQRLPGRLRQSLPAQVRTCVNCRPRQFALE